MTINEIRKAFSEKFIFCCLANTGLESFYEAEQRTFEELYKNGTVTNFSNEFLAFANGYQTTMNEYENLHISQTLDLRRISATKAVTRKMMQRWLNI